MVKAYLRYEPAAAFGVIASVDSNIAYDSSGKHLLAPALEKVGVWHVRQGVCTKTLTPSPSSRGSSFAVTSIASSQSSLVINTRLFLFVLLPPYLLLVVEKKKGKRVLSRFMLFLFLVNKEIRRVI